MRFREMIRDTCLVFLFITVITVLFCVLEFYLPPAVLAPVARIREGICARIAGWLAGGGV